jgi:hypothetical protein
LSRADWIKLMIAAARLPLRNEPANSQFERPEHDAKQGHH